MSGVLELGGRIGSDIYRRLSKIELAAPDIDTFSDTVAYWDVDETIIAESSGTCHSSGSGATLGGK